MSRSPERAFADRLRAERQQQGLSQADVAGRLSVELGAAIDKSALARMERGERGIRLNEAVAIADVLRLPLLRLLEDEDVRDAELRQARYELESAELLLRSASEEVERREADVEEARARVREIEHQDLADEVRSDQWPLGG